MYSKFEDLLKKNNVKVAKVSKETGISAQIFTNWKRKGSGSLNAENMKKIADYFNVGLGYFYDNEDEYIKAFEETHREMIDECKLQKEVELIARAYINAPEWIKQSVCKLLDIERR